MSVANAIFNVAALAFSFMAVVISAVSARRQTADARRANVMMFLAELGQRTRAKDFRKARDYIMTQLSQHDPALGIYRLPEPAQDAVVLVGGFYQHVGTLVVTGVFTEELAAAMYYTDIKDMWRALEPYILGERENRRLRGGGSVFGSFEHLAVYVNSVSHDEVRRKFVRRSFPGTEIDPVKPVTATSVNKDGAAQPQPPEG